MGWVRWLKDLADRLPDEDGPGERRGSAAKPPRGRQGKGGDAYAREWVKVLEESATKRDPNATYTWELSPEAKAARTGPQAAVPARKPRPADAADPADTYTWEVSETDSPDDPWGLNAEKPAAKESADGLNPYDTGVFNASWTGRFDRR